MKQLIFISIILYVTISFSETKVIRLAADEWCPLTCEPNSKIGRGILFDIATEALKKSNYKIDYTFISWARASQMVEKNKINGLVGVNDTEFPNLSLTDSVIESKDCFFGLKSNSKLSKSTYKDVNSLVGLKVGTINGYGYGDQIDQFKSSETGKNIFEDGVGDSAVLQNLKKLQNSRIDLILENQLVVNYLKAQGLAPKDMFEYHCLENKKIFIAFNSLPENKKVIEIINHFLKSKSNEPLIQKIVNKYK